MAERARSSEVKKAKKQKAKQKRKETVMKRQIILAMTLVLAASTFAGNGIRLADWNAGVQESHRLMEVGEYIPSVTEKEDMTISYVRVYKCDYEEEINLKDDLVSTTLFETASAPDLGSNTLAVNEPVVDGDHTQVPEPATMALLGLGGVLLRRRKRS
jgi:hypothetical protein